MFIVNGIFVLSLLSISSHIAMMSSSSHACKNFSKSQASLSVTDDSVMELPCELSFPELYGKIGVRLLGSCEKAIYAS